ncbi:MAG: stage II sporulation protein P, partial [Desulfocucumaceae bacterium]
MNYYVRYLLYRHRYALASVYRTVSLYGVLLLLFFLLYYSTSAGVFSKIYQSKSFSLLNSWSERDPGGLIRSAAPVLAWGGSSEDLPEEITPQSLITAILAPFRINLKSPADLLASGIPTLAEYRRGPAPPVAYVAATLQEGAPKGLSEDVLVGIYHTHTGETYTLTDGVERLDGQKGGVVEAGRAVKETLERGYGIRAAHYDRVNDAIYSTSYTESEKLARQLLEENQEVQIVLDIHRDAGKTRNDSIVKINGEDLAPILFVVGSDARAPFPTWRNNHSFAVRLSERINREYPGLCIG